MQDLIERLRALHVWPQSTADEYADTLTPRRIAALYEVGKVAHEAADYITTLEAKLAVAREALEPVRDFLIHEVGFEDDDEPLTAILRALKEIER